ncbi:lysoplasmalogenase [Georgenia alba]|uniref:Lysoplasmalogenase n=1 Tax=Georgenia alba TaxID=2233858 RepID=A0ABW2Q7K4_9MICO
MSAARSRWWRLPGIQVTPIWHIFVGVAVVHLAAQLFGWQAVADLTQVLLMPALAFSVVATGIRSPIVTWVLVALTLSWLGDSAPRIAEGDVAFLLMVVFFMLAQVAYLRAFFPLWRAWQASRALRVAPLVAYGVVAVVLVVWCAPGAGALLPAVVLYAVVLCAMATLAVSLGMHGLVGGALFVISDGLIAIRSFTGFTPPLDDFVVMITYVAAQALLVEGALRVVLRQDVQLTGRRPGPER